MEDIVVVRREGGKVDSTMKAMNPLWWLSGYLSYTSCFLLLLKNTRKEEFLYQKLRTNVYFEIQHIIEFSVHLRFFFLLLLLSN